MQAAGWDLSISRRAPPQTCEVANVSGGSLRILWPLLLLLVVTISCGEDDSSGTKWGGTYGVPDEFGGGSGSVSFVVESNDEIFCLSSPALNQAIRQLVIILPRTVSHSMARSSRYPSRRATELSR
jgi:hypothetical protein